MRLPPGLLVAIGVGLVTLLAIAQLVLRSAGGTRSFDIRDDRLRAILVNLGLVGIATGVFVVTVAIQQALNPPRYDYIPVTLICAASVFGAALIGRGAVAIAGAQGLVGRAVVTASRLALPAIVIVLAVGWARSFRLDAKASVGPDVVAAFDAAAPGCGSDQRTITLPISPPGRGWKVEIPCDRVRGR